MEIAYQFCSSAHEIENEYISVHNESSEIESLSWIQLQENARKVESDAENGGKKFLIFTEPFLCVLRYSNNGNVFEQLFNSGNSILPKLTPVTSTRSKLWLHLSKIFVTNIRVIKVRGTSPQYLYSKITSGDTTVDFEECV